MKIVHAFRTALIICSILYGTAAMAVPVTLQTNSSGVLTGAENVDVGGVLYNVSFADGSCNSIFNGCNSAAFAFHNSADAGLAAQALLDQVFVDGVMGQFDSDPSKTLGCTSTVACDTLIPYSPLLTGVVVVAFSGNVPTDPDGVANNSPQSSQFDTVFSPFANYAIFELASPGADVPEPDSLLLLAAAVGGMMLLRRRKRIAYETDFRKLDTAANSRRNHSAIADERESRVRASNRPER
ncbi:PEP-CTERM sorting domain-containing protein [Massilia sp. R2A-15]|uniref:PEP-CTERM sorting domain-containing protein n=1 Tax=Massilia sp. R2A-15 TaxID=3064278 RepID=UPI0027347D92|nr:PEP-CTERM sorting domain-containing protein [Massilia sp. R2A-15]WLI89232.1 PEP-CTERM sorting domain-containing protein [Massilia sp. R2A-15]